MVTLEAKRLRICPFCEAACGLELTVSERDVHTVRGDKDDQFSQGYLCPKGVAIQDLDSDPDRLRAPMMRNGDSWRKATWNEAFDAIDRNLTRISSQHGRDATGLYLGNPVVHNTALTLYVPVLRKALGTRNVFTASSVDQIPKQLAVGLMFGNALSIPIPDIDRSKYLLILGANPLVSNGSLLTAPDIGRRLEQLRQRGGKLVVIDPRRTKTAQAADEHHFIRPGGDACFLLAIVHTLVTENLTSPGRLLPLTNGIERVEELARTFSPEAVSSHCGIDANMIRRIARELAAADSAAVYGRIGTCTQQFGTLASWLVEVIHLLTGNLDRPGGVMFPTAAHGPGNTKGIAGVGRGLRIGRWKSRVRGYPEIFGELPVACLAEEIETPGDGRIRALFTIAGNPLLSAPNSTRMSRAFESLEFMVSLDIYLNETTRHADVILPGLSPLENGHYDFIFSQLSVRNHARYSSPLFDVPNGQLSEWEILLRLTGIASGQGSRADTTALDDAIMRKLIQREANEATSSVHGRDSEEILAALHPRRGPWRMTDFMLRTGPYGDGFGACAEGLSLTKLERSPHGIDLGPLQPRIPQLLRTRSGKIELAPEQITQDIDRLKQHLAAGNRSMVLIGRRELRSNNSWMHNLKRLAAGRSRCTLQINPTDAVRLGLNDCERATVSSRVGSVEIPVELTDDMFPGVVSIPHGWGHDDSAATLRIAQVRPGVNSNRLADDEVVDVVSGNAVLCGIPVTIARTKNREAAPAAT